MKDWWFGTLRDLHTDKEEPLPYPTFVYSLIHKKLPCVYLCEYNAECDRLLTELSWTQPSVVDLMMEKEFSEMDVTQWVAP